MGIKKIVIIDSSEIIRRGIVSVLRSKSYQYEVNEMKDCSMLHIYLKNNSPSIIIINPSLSVENSGERLKQLRQDAINSNFKLIALVYAYYDEHILSMFDDSIYINDPESRIHEKIDKLIDASNDTVPVEENASLSQRELDVVKQVALGFSNKDIADKLCISIHTVISHRKNITAKLGIKSASGLTIYAVINKLISSNDFDKTV